MGSTIILDPHQFFLASVEDAFQERKFQTHPQVKTYIVDLLKFHLSVENLFDEKDESGRKTRKTMAELFLSANQESKEARLRKLKILGDRSLYISGFFADSLQRKIIDIDYYVDMGTVAFESLAKAVNEDTFSHLFREISVRFLDLVDVLTVISKKAQIAEEDNVLRMMDLYAKTGSSLIGEDLVAKGIFNRPDKKVSKQ